MKNLTKILLTALLCASFLLLTACAPAKKEGIALAETYLQHLISQEYDAAYALISDFDKENIDQATYVEWRQLVAQIIRIKSAQVDSSVDRFKDYAYQGTTIGYALGLKISRDQEILIPDIELDGYNTANYREMVVYENGQWKMLLLLTDLKEKVAQYRALLDKQK